MVLGEDERCISQMRSHVVAVAAALALLSCVSVEGSGWRRQAPDAHLQEAGVRPCPKCPPQGCTTHRCFFYDSSSSSDSSDSSDYWDYLFYDSDSDSDSDSKPHHKPKPSSSKPHVQTSSSKPHHKPKPSSSKPHVQTSSSKPDVETSSSKPDVETSNSPPAYRMGSCPEVREESCPSRELTFCGCCPTCITHLELGAPCVTRPPGTNGRCRPPTRCHNGRCVN